MNHLSYFSDKDLAVELVNTDNLKIKGLSSLPGNLRNQVLKYAKEHKRQILIEICMQDKSIRVSEFTFPCPARCKRSGKCYGKAYFDAKPGKALLCIAGQCPWSNKLEEYLGREL